MKIFDSIKRIMFCGLLFFISFGCGKTASRSPSSGSGDATISDISMTLPRRALLENEVVAIKRLMTHYRLRYETVLPCTSRGFIEVAPYRDEGLVGLNVDRSCEIMLSMEYGYNLKSDGSGDVYYASNRMRFSSDDLGGGSFNFVDNDELLQSQNSSQDIASQSSVGSSGGATQQQETTNNAQTSRSTNQNISSQNQNTSSAQQTDFSQQSDPSESGINKKRYFRVDFDMRLTELGRQLGLKTEAFRNTEEQSENRNESFDNSRNSATKSPESDVQSSSPAPGAEPRDDVNTGGFDDNRGDILSEPFEGLDDENIPLEEDNSTQLNVTYDGNIQLLLNDNCTSCHSPGGLAASIDLSTEESAKNFASQSNNSIQNDRMPPETPLSADDKEIFDAWVEGGSQ